MGAKAREYTKSTLKKLFLLSCNQCAAPGCDNALLARDDNTLIAKICHIEAASPNGPRYNPNMTDEERRHYNNLILLCDECHSIIDNKENENKYPVELLRKWKREHESLCMQNMLNKHPSLLAQAINAIANINLDEVKIETDQVKSFEISKKIEHNALKRNKYLIEELSKYYGKINSLYGELENQGSFKKEKLLRIIKMIYIRIKSKYINGQHNELAIIQKNADNIFEEVENKILDIIDKNKTNDENIAIALPIILVDAFMRCKILEEPVK